MTNHNHKEECKHEKLKYCKECDVVECECGREWKREKKGQCALCGMFGTPGTIHICS